MNKNIAYIQKHQKDFQADDVLPLTLFKEFIKSQKNGSIECSCKISNETIFTNRYNFWFDSPFDPDQLNSIMGLFDSITQKTGVTLCKVDFENFYGNNFDWSNISQFVAGIDAREDIPSSRLKIWFILKNYPEKTQKAIELCRQPDLINTFIIKKDILIGFDFFLNGKSSIKLYPDFHPNEINFSENLKHPLMNLYPAALDQIRQSNWVHICFPGSGNQKILHFHISSDSSIFKKLTGKNSDTIKNFIRLNDPQNMVVSIPENEFLDNEFKNWNFYYMPGLKTEIPSILNWSNENIAEEAQPK